MRYLSVCSGIEAATVAWHPLGWEPVAFSEIDNFPCKVLAHHYPTVPNMGDLHGYSDWPKTKIDILVGGTPCQSFSVAGLRRGLADPRGNLMLVYLGLVDHLRPTWIVWENVPGVLSSNGGRDFGTFLGALGELGYGFAYRVLDAQFFGVPQRRRRVFVVGCLGDWRGAAAVLFERASLSGHPAPSREAGKVAPTIPSRRTAGGGLGTDFDCDGGLIPQTVGALCANTSINSYSGQDAYTGRLIPQVANPLTARMYKGIITTCDEGQTMIAHSLRGEGFDASEDGTGRGTPLVPVAFHNRQDPDVSGDVTHPLGAKDNGMAVAFAQNQRDEVRTMEVAGAAKPGAKQQTYLRRLTPVECERLQGFPDGYTDIRPNGKPTPDGPRYKALGNSMAVPVMRWIGTRIQRVELPEWLR